MTFAVESSAAVIISKTKMDATTLPEMPITEKDMDSYMLQVYEITLTSILVELKDLFDSDHSRHLDLRQISKDILKSYTSLLTDVWHTELSQKTVDELDTLKPKYVVSCIRATINHLVDRCVII